MKISFIFTPYSHKLFEENVRIVDEEFGCFPPLNLCYAAAIARDAGHDVQVLDANALGLTKDEAAEHARAFGAEAIGFYLSTYMVRETLLWATHIKARLNVPMLAGGVCTWLYPAETMANDVVDYSIQGEAVRSLPLLLQAMERGELPSGIPGVWYRDGDKVRHEEPYDDFVPFDDYPFPMREGLPNDRYYSFTSQRKNFTVMLTQIGCPFRCVFCPIPINKYRARSPESVLAEVDECYTRYGIREIDFFDAEFPANRKRLHAIMDGLEKYENLEWSCRSRVDTVDGETLRRMYEVGCRKIYFGIESASQDALNDMHKDISLTAVKTTIRECKKTGIRPLGFFMVGVHGETRDTFRRTVKLAVSLPLDYVQYSRMIPKPRTGLDDEIVEATGRDYWSEYVRGDAVEERFPNIWSKVPEEELEQMTKWAYYRFYYRPAFVLRAIVKMKSWSEIVRSFRVAVRMLTDYLRPEVKRNKRKTGRLEIIEPLSTCGTSMTTAPHPGTTHKDS